MEPIESRKGRHLGYDKDSGGTTVIARTWPCTPWCRMGSLLSGRPLGGGEQMAQACANAFHENAVYVKSESAILMLFSMLSFLKPTFLS